MKKYLPYLKNKFLLASIIFVLYSLFLDENDIFTIMRQRRQLNELEKATVETQENLDQTLNTIARLKYTSEVERFAREKKLFKKDGEDVFVIFYE